MTTEEQSAFDTLAQQFEDTKTALAQIQAANDSMAASVTDLTAQLGVSKQTIETMLADRKNLTELLENAKLDVVTERKQKDIYNAQFATQERKLEALSEQLKLRRAGKIADELVQEAEPKRGTAGML